MPGQRLTMQFDGRRISACQWPLKLRASPCFCTFATVAAAIGPSRASASFCWMPGLAHCPVSRRPELRPAAAIRTSLPRDTWPSHRHGSQTVGLPAAAPAQKDACASRYLPLRHRNEFPSTPPDAASGSSSWHAPTQSSPPLARRRPPTRSGPALHSSASQPARSSPRAVQPAIPPYPQSQHPARIAKAPARRVWRAHSAVAHAPALQAGRPHRAPLQATIPVSQPDHRGAASYFHLGTRAAPRTGWCRNEFRRHRRYSASSGAW